MEAGADDYLTKPLDPVALETRLLAARRVTSLHLQLGDHRRQLAELARIDPLTNLGNRRSLGEDLAVLHARSRRYGRSYSLALLDVDHFKAYNDTYGHPAGDEALRAVASTLAVHARHTDGVYRYGGEEFLMVLPEQAPPGAIVVVERVRRAVEGLAIRHAAGVAGVLTVSVGLAAFHPGRDVTGEELMKEADLALYDAKTAGRNAVVPATPD
jgi:two-component system chemotaxis response regulator CheY